MKDKPDNRRVADFMTFEEAAAHLGIALSAVYSAARRGDLRTAEVLGKTVLVKASVLSFMPRPNRRRSSQGRG